MTKNKGLSQFHIRSPIKYIKRASTINRDSGFSTLIEKVPPFTYQQIWPFLPRGQRIQLNGVEIGKRKRIPDDYLPEYLTRYVPGDDQDYEEQYVGCIRSYIETGESVVIVGGGEGVSTVTTAKQVGETGRVNVYEGGTVQAEKTSQTAKINGVDDIVTVTNAIISANISLRSSGDGVTILPPTDLPACDTLAIDADGAEKSILTDLEQRPARLIVEHHLVLDDGEQVLEYKPDEIRSIIRELGYEIVEERAHPTRAYGAFEERIFVAEYRE